MRKPAVLSSILLSCLLLAGACQPQRATTSAPAISNSTPAATPAAPLRGTHWALRLLNGQPLTPTPAQEVYMQLGAAEQQAQGQAGCNRFRGTFELPAEGQLRFGALLSTRMACPDLPTETRFMAALTATRFYRISGDTLYLHGEGASDTLATLLAQKQ